MYSKERCFGVHETESSNDSVSYDSHICVSVWGVCAPRTPADEFAFCLSTPTSHIFLHLFNTPLQISNYVCTNITAEFQKGLRMKSSTVFT